MLLRERAVPQRAARERSLARVASPRLAAHLARGARASRLRLACWPARVFYQAGIAVVIALAAVYAEQVLGFQQTETMMLVFLVNIAVGRAAPSAFGYVQDRIGHRRGAGASPCVGWIVMTDAGLPGHRRRTCSGWRP